MKVDSKKDLNSLQILILCHNVQSLKNQLLEITVLLLSDLKNVVIIRYTEHWLKVERIGLRSTDHCTLVVLLVELVMNTVICVHR
jgi:hypothetical protein